MTTTSARNIFDGEYYYVNINPQYAFIHRQCFADSDCLELIGQKSKDAGISNTLFYTKDYNVFAKSGDPGIITRISKDKVWIKLSKTDFECRGPKDIYW